MGKGLPVNEAIRAREVLLLDEHGNNLGIVSREEALALARGRGMDLLQLAMASSPPRCRLGDARSQQETAARQARAQRAGNASPKELRLRTATGAHDVATQVRRAAQLLAAGHQVKVTVLLDKAERGNPTAARVLLASIARDLGPTARQEGKPVPEKGALSLLFSPPG
ncbi:MAG: translation initiation factor IF-3 [Chloroflexota bacterium]